MKTWITSDGTKIIRVIGGRSNVFLLTGGNRNILIDTSPAFMRKTLESRLDRLKISSLDLLILTHAHFDHAENAAWIKEKYHSKVLIHKDESEYLEAGNTELPGGTNPFSGILVKYISRFIKSPGSYQSCRSDYSAGEEFDLKEFGLNAYVLHTPGHTRGSVSVIVNREIAIVGDAMFGVFPGSVFPPFADDVKMMVESWGKLLDTGCSLFLPSHGSENSRQLVMREYIKKKKEKV